MVISLQNSSLLFISFHSFSSLPSLPLYIIRVTATNYKSAQRIMRRRNGCSSEFLLIIFDSKEEIKEEEMEEREDKDKRKRKKIRRKRKEKEIETGSATAAEATVICKKSDGKGWHCKRPANLPHSLCLYHLAQLRSYSYSHSKVTNPVNGGQFSVQKKRGDASGGGGNLYYYYYYAGFGPWRGKRRGDKTGDVVNGSDTAIKEERGEEEEEEEEGGKEESGYGDECDAPVAGDDEEEGDEDDGRVLGDDDDEEEDSSDEEKNRNHRKRGRKPVKARSLKSLL